MATLADLEAAYIRARITYRNSDLNYREYVRETPLDEFIGETEQYLAMRPKDHKEFMVAWRVWRVYVAAKVFAIARDEGTDAALLWKLANGGAA